MAMMGFGALVGFGVSMFAPKDWPWWKQGLATILIIALTMLAFVAFGDY